MHSFTSRVSLLFAALLTGSQANVFASPGFSEPTAQEIADRHNRVIAEAATHMVDDEKILAMFLNSISRREAQVFISPSDVEWLAPELKKGWEFAPMGYVRKEGERVSFWAVSFDEGGDDIVLRLNIRNGEVAAFSIIHGNRAEPGATDNPDSADFQSEKSSSN